MYIHVCMYIDIANEQHPDNLGPCPLAEQCGVMPRGAAMADQDEQIAARQKAFAPHLSTRHVFFSIGLVAAKMSCASHVWDIPPHAGDTSMLKSESRSRR